MWREAISSPHAAIPGAQVSELLVYFGTELVQPSLVGADARRRRCDAGSSNLLQFLELVRVLRGDIGELRLMGDGLKLTGRLRRRPISRTQF